MLTYLAIGLIVIFWIAMFGWLLQNAYSDDVYDTDLEEFLFIDEQDPDDADVQQQRTPQDFSNLDLSKFQDNPYIMKRVADQEQDFQEEEVKVAK